VGATFIWLISESYPLPGFCQGVELTSVDFARVLTLPNTCSETFETQPTVEQLEKALYKTEIYDQIDVTANVTCLAPDDAAFALTGKKPPEAWNETAIDQLVLYVTTFYKDERS
jgi:hypothetical protein